MDKAPKPQYDPSEIELATTLERSQPNDYLATLPQDYLPAARSVPKFKTIRTLKRTLPGFFNADTTNPGFCYGDYHFAGGTIYGMETPIHVSASRTTTSPLSEQSTNIFGAMCLWGSCEVMARLDTGQTVHPRVYTGELNRQGKIVDFVVQNDRPYRQEASARIAGTMARIWHYASEQRGTSPTSLHMQVPNEEYLTIGVKWLLDGHISVDQLQTYRDIVNDKAGTLKVMIQEIFGHFGIDAITFQHPLARSIGSLSTNELIQTAERHPDKFMLDPNCGDTAIGRSSYVYAMTKPNRPSALNVYVHPASQRRYWNQAKSANSFNGVIISPCELYITPSDTQDWSMYRKSPLLVTEKMRTVDPWLVA